MPQLDPATFAPQLIWLAIVFTGLYFAMSRLALPRIGGVIEQRRDRIASDLDEAARLKEQTEKAIADYETALAEARARAHVIAQQTRDDMKEAGERERARLDRELGERIARAETRIALAKDKALGEVGKMAGEAAGDIVEALTGKPPSKRALNDALRSAL